MGSICYQARMIPSFVSIVSLKCASTAFNNIYLFHSTGLNCQSTLLLLTCSIGIEIDVPSDIWPTEHLRVARNQVSVRVLIAVEPYFRSVW